MVPRRSPRFKREEARAAVQPASLDALNSEATASHSCHAGRDIVILDSTEASPRPLAGHQVANTLVQQMGRESVAEAMRPLLLIEVNEAIEHCQGARDVLQQRVTPSMLWQAVENAGQWKEVIPLVREKAELEQYRYWEWPQKDEVEGLRED